VRGRSLEAPDAESFAVDVLHPAPDDPFLHELNDLSVALRWRHRGEAILTLGDLETPGLTRLLQTPEDLQARVLLLPHHGHACPALRDLLARVRPEIVLVSGAGTSDARAIVEELRTGGITVLATWERGALRLRWVEGRGWTPLPWY
jgi:beta-lactamase superfamily II metal-dependent hydrolase